MVCKKGPYNKGTLKNSFRNYFDFSYNTITYSNRQFEYFIVLYCSAG